MEIEWDKAGIAGILWLMMVVFMVMLPKSFGSTSYFKAWRACSLVDFLREFNF